MNNMLAVCVVLAHKGGVGKTLTLRLLYQAIARLMRKNAPSKKILVVDVDPQGDTSSRLIAMESETRGSIQGLMPPIHPALGERSDISDIWLRGVAPEPYETFNPFIDIVPARETNLYEVARNSQPAMIYGIREWLSAPEIREKYLAVFIDTPPNKGELTQAAVKAATHCYIPVEYEPNPVKGANSMLHFVDTEILSRKPGEPTLKNMGIVANKVPTNNAQIYHAYRNEMRNNPILSQLMLRHELKDLAAFVETDSTSTLPGDIFDYPVSSHEHVILQAESFCKEILSKMEPFAGWKMDFRKGESFYKNEAGVI